MFPPCRSFHHTGSWALSLRPTPGRLWRGTWSTAALCSLVGSVCCAATLWRAFSLWWAVAGAAAVYPSPRWLPSAGRGDALPYSDAPPRGGADYFRYGAIPAAAPTIRHRLHPPHRGPSCWQPARRGPRRGDP